MSGKMRTGFIVVAAAGAICGMATANADDYTVPAGQGAAFDPLVTRWTFGAHEPYTMYRRVGKRCTGGIEGSAKWLGGWLDWWDAHAPERMEEFGLNGLHSRFYKGMGWETEKKDFPNVRKFVRNCHAHGVTALAYVQFSTLYFETLRREIPDVDDWAQVDERGEKRFWNGQYFRWMPCVTCEAWQAYVEKVLEIALAEGGFDGIMFDNLFVRPCYCARCERRFAEHLASVPDREARFGFADVSGVRQPLPKPGTDAKDPVLQEWIRWRVSVVDGVMARFRRKIKSVKPGAIVSANAQPFRRGDAAAEFSLEMVSMAGNLDLLMMQSDNFPGVGDGGMVFNRVRDLKIAAELGKPVVALCDADAGAHALDETAYLRPLIEDLVWGGIPTDRTVMCPARTPTYIDEGRFAARRPRMAALNAFAASHRAELSSPALRPVRIFYPASAHMFSPEARDGVTAAEEIFLRGRVPFGYLIARGAEMPEVPAGCETLVVADQRWLSDAQVDGLARWARAGGRLVVTGESGLWDESGAQRFENPLRSALAGLPGVVWRDAPDKVGGTLGWKYRVKPPADGGKALLADLAKAGWKAPVRFEGLPPHVFAEYKRLPSGALAVHLVNYDPAHPVAGAKIALPQGAAATAEEPFGADSAARPLPADGALPAFAQYLLVVVK